MRPSASMLTDELTIITPSVTTNRVGDERPDWTNVTRRTVRGRISQRERREDNDHRSAQIGTWVAYLPGGTSIDGRCRITRGTQTFEVVGPPYEPTAVAGVTHIECTLELVEG